jgi:2-polyprenyl-3-methyl-5-hydroxy-6-metoxy-1,4-benzoquinol methylase
MVQSHPTFIEIAGRAISGGTKPVAGCVCGRDAAAMPSETAYHDTLGDFFASNADVSPYNAFTDRPAVLGLAGDVSGADILDVGCGAGHCAAELLARGPRVTGIDGSATLLRHARGRVQDRAVLRLHDLEQPLDFAADASFDGIVCALVIHHVTNRRRLLSEMRRVLRPGGWLVMSTTHPSADWRYFGGSYYDEAWVDLPFGLPGGAASAKAAVAVPVMMPPLSPDRTRPTKSSTTPIAPWTPSARTNTTVDSAAAITDEISIGRRPTTSDIRPNSRSVVSTPAA